MKRTIRTNCFETNSSSTHSITIDNHSGKESVFGRAVRCNEFGWEHEKFNDFETKASYFWTLAQHDSFSKVRVGGSLRERLERLEIEHGFTLMSPDDTRYHYVDHGWEHYDDMTTKHPSLLTDEGLFDFMISEAAWIMLGNDNCYDTPNFRLTEKQIEECKRFLTLVEDPSLRFAMVDDETNYAELAAALYFERNPYSSTKDSWRTAWPRIKTVTDNTIEIDLVEWSVDCKAEVPVTTKTLNYIIETK